MQQLNYISQNTALTLVLFTSLLFALIGILYSRKYRGYSNYLTAGRKTGTLSLTCRFVVNVSAITFSSVHGQCNPMKIELQIILWAGTPGGLF